MNHNLPNKYCLLFLYQVLRPFKMSLLLIFFLAIAWSIDFSLRPYVLKIIIDKASQDLNNNVIDHVTIPAISYFLLTILYTTLFRIYGYFVEIKMIPNLRQNIINVSFDLLLNQNFSFYRTHFIGSLSSKINDLFVSIPEIIQIAFGCFLRYGVALMIALFTLWQVNFYFAIGMVIWSISFILGSIFLSKKIATLSDNWSEQCSGLIGQILDSLTNILSVKLFVGNKNEIAFLSDKLNSTGLSEQKLQWVYFWMWCIYSYLFVLINGVSLYILLIGRKQGWVTIGDFILVLNINFIIVDLLKQLTKDFSQFSNLWGKINQALRTITLTPKIQDKSDAIPININMGCIVFEDVNFKYDNKNLFNNLSLTIRGGEKIALVGSSGSGKSTFANLILRLYDVKSGRILIDGQDIREVTQDSLHMAITVIPSDISLFHRSIIDNIKYGTNDYKYEEIVSASKRAYAHEFILELPEGYNSLVGERGMNISSGQRQRIALARAILKNTKILIIDEATSNLDADTEVKVQHTISELIYGKTAIIISHNLPNIINVDRILVFENGTIVEEGNHKELMAKNGFYKNLWVQNFNHKLKTKNKF